MDLEERIGIYYTTLTKTEKKVYQAVLANPKPSLEMSIQDAAKTYRVSVASIQRFVKKVGYQGYPEFKLDVAKFIKEDAQTPVSETRLQRVMRGYVQTFQTLATLDLEPQLTALAKAMHAHQSIKAIGIGNSGLSAEQLAYSMYSEERFIEPVTDRIRVDYLSQAVTDQDLLIIFSVTGSTASYQTLLTAAKRKHAASFLITMNQETPLLRLADEHIILPSTHINDANNTPYQVDNRTILYGFSEVISYYYATSKSPKLNSAKA